MAGTHPFVRTGATVAVVLPTGDPLQIRHVIGVGRNYAEHAAEMQAEAPERPLLFSKNPASVAIPGEDVVIPRICQDREQVDYEGELAVVIGRDCKDVPEADALAPGGPVLGYCCADDVSARWWQKQGAGGQFNRGKSFDTFCPLGPAVTPTEAVPDVQSLRLTTTVSGERAQDASTGLMLFSVARLVAECSAGTTLLAGTVILTGTPKGVGFAKDPPRFLRDGDEVTVEIESLGALTHRVRTER